MIQIHLASKITIILSNSSPVIQKPQLNCHTTSVLIVTSIIITQYWIFLDKEVLGNVMYTHSCTIECQIRSVYLTVLKPLEC